MKPIFLKLINSIYFHIALLTFLFLILLPSNQVEAKPKNSVIIHQLTHLQWRFHVIQYPDPQDGQLRYLIESCKNNSCRNWNGDKGIPHDSPDWPLRINNLVQVGQDIWAGTSGGILVFNPGQLSWVPLKTKTPIYDVSSLVRVDDHVFATRDGGADVCGVYHWSIADEVWTRIKETGCFAYTSSLVYKNAVYVSNNYSISKIEIPTLKLTNIALPSPGAEIVNVSKDKGPLTVKFKSSKNPCFQANYDGSQWTNKIPCK